MAAESSNDPGCAANSAHVADRLSLTRVHGRPHRRGSACSRTGRLVRVWEFNRNDAGTSLGQGTESLPAIVGRRAGSRLGLRRIRPSARRHFSDIRLRTAAVESAPTVVGTTSVDCRATVQSRVGALGAVASGRHSQLRPVHATDRRSFFFSVDARGNPRSEHRYRQYAVSCRFVSSTSSEKDGRNGRRGGTLPNHTGSICSRVRSRGTWIDGSNGAILRTHTGRDRVRTAAVQHTQLSLGS